MPRAAGRGCALVVAAAALAASLCACGLIGLSQLWLPRANWPIGYTAFLCVNASTRPNLQVRVDWMLPQLMSSLSPLAPWRAGCAWLPWLPALPPAGHLAYPP